MSEDNLKLWNSVCETDPKYTKPVTFGFKQTAIDPQYQLRLGTEQWGQYGSKWGIKDLQWSTHDNSVILNAIFWYPSGEFPMCVDAPWEPNKDTYKKLITEARSKSLSYLGFNADVYLGQYDDNRYVQAMKEKHTPVTLMAKDTLELSLGRIAESTDLTKLRNWFSDQVKKKAVTEDQRSKLEAALSERQSQLDSKEGSF